MYVRHPLVQRGSPRRRLSRWSALSSPTSSPALLSAAATNSVDTSTRAAASTLTVASPTEGSSTSRDFDHYVRAECTDALFTCASNSLSTAAPPLASSPPSPTRYLHGGSEVVALPATHAILNNINSAVWLHVLTNLQARGALTSRDCAAAIRYLPAFTYQPLLPWLWTPSASTGAALQSRGGRSGSADASGGMRRAENAVVEESLSFEESAMESDSVAEVYNNLSLVALEVARRTPSSPVAAAASPVTSAAPAVPQHVTSCTLADLSTAAPQLWCAMAQFLVSALPTSATSAADRQKLWHDIFFTLRTHAAWNTTSAELRDVAHPQLLSVFRAFYADMQSHAGDINKSSESKSSSRAMTSSTAAALAVVTLTPPILLRKFRALYRQHRHSAMLFAELYAYCVKQEEQHVRCWATAVALADSISGDFNAEAPHASSASTMSARHVRSTALLMDLDLAVYFASLPGRRHSGLSTAAEQWSATLRHLQFLLPRMYALQRCLQIQQQQGQQQEQNSTLSWEPWRRVAVVLMNVCAWVANDNREAVRCCEALRCAVSTLTELSSPFRSGQGDQQRVQTEELRSEAELHRALVIDALTEADVACVVSTLMSAAVDSMRAKADQLHYGPTDGLFGVSLLSVAVSAVLPPHKLNQNTISKPSSLAKNHHHHNRNTDNDQIHERQQRTREEESEAAGELLHQLQVCTHAAKPTPAELWSALRRSPRAAEAARHGLVTVGFRLFRDCVVPQAARDSTLATAQRLYRLLCAWASAVGRPLGLDGTQVSTLWQMRWAQQQQQQREGGAAADGDGDDKVRSRRRSHVRSTAALQQRLTPVHRQRSHRHHTSSHHHVQHHHGGCVTPQREWTCGCGFRNTCDNEASLYTDVSAASLSCVACVLRELVPHSWECPHCHHSTASGVAVPYCLHCGEAHPALAGQHTQSSEKSEDVVREAAPEVIYVCAACHTVSPHAPPSVTEAPQSPAEAALAPLKQPCARCGSADDGYYTAGFSWVCGCGTTNSALHDYCTACSRAAQYPALTCPQCHHSHAYTLTGTGVEGEATDAGVAPPCPYCHYPHPRLAAARDTGRLVHCPACHGLAPATARACPHCASTALGVVAALLPTVADQPWLCLHCGSLHPVRDATTGALLPPPPLPLHGWSFDAPTSTPRTASLHAVETRDGDAQKEGVVGRKVSPCSEGCCDYCGTRRVPADVWEASHLWNCAACGTLYNTGAACRQCAALAPGVPGATVSVWRCAICGADHPSWQTRCTTAGCGGSVNAPALSSLEEQQVARSQHTPAHEEGGAAAATRENKATLSDAVQDEGRAHHRIGQPPAAAAAAAVARYCYSPWECAACGHVTLSAHLPCCTACGAATPAEVTEAAACLLPACAAKTFAQDSAVDAEAICSSSEQLTALHRAEDAAKVESKGAPAASLLHSTHGKEGSSRCGEQKAGEAAQQAKSQPPISRLAAVEAFLLHAADTTAPLHSVSLDNTLVPFSTDASLWPVVTGTAAKKPAEGEVKPAMSSGGAEAWEDAYTAAVLSF